MLRGDIDIPFPENLGDPVNADPASMRFQDLVLAFPQSVDLGRFAVPAAFRAARELDQISGSGFENVGIKVCQCKSPRLFRFMIKKWQMAIKFRITIEGRLGIIQKLLCAGFVDNIGKLPFSGSPAVGLA